jgi:hypothetical protein
MHVQTPFMVVPFYNSPITRSNVFRDLQRRLLAHIRYDTCYVHLFNLNRI